MLEHVPHWLGQALAGLRAGADKLAIAQSQLAPQLPDPLPLSSPAFSNGGDLPPRFTADGAGISPPLSWPAPPAGAAMLVLLVEDADAPTPQPLVHAVLWGLPRAAGELAEGAIVSGDDVTQGDVGRNSYLIEGWLPPDPPTGHGPHRYCFQLFALNAAMGDPGPSPGRSSVIEAMAGKVIASGLLTGVYERGRPFAATQPDMVPHAG